MLPFCSICSCCAIRVCGEGPGGAFGVRDHHVSIDQGVGRRAIEPAVKPRLLDLKLTVRIRPCPGSSRLVHLGRTDKAGRAPDPSKDVPESVVAPDDETAHPARECMEAVGVEWLRAFASRSCSSSVLGRVPTPLVSATGELAPKTQGDAEPQPAAHAVL